MPPAAPARDLARHWTLDPAITFLNHGSFGACPRPVLEAQQALRDQLEREPARFFDREAPGAARCRARGNSWLLPRALGLSKWLLDASSSVTLAQAPEDEARCQHITHASKDVREGIAAFLERRELRFSGC